MFISTSSKRFLEPRTKRVIPVEIDKITKFFMESDKSYKFPYIDTMGTIIACDSYTYDVITGELIAVFRNGLEGKRAYLAINFDRKDIEYFDSIATDWYIYETINTNFIVVDSGIISNNSVTFIQRFSSTILFTVYVA